MEKIAGVELELPVDLLFEILTKLPAKSLCRFRCVSKLWGSVIADPIFVEAHHAFSAARPEFLILFSGAEWIRHQFDYDAVGMELLSPDNRDLTRTYGISVYVQEFAIPMLDCSHQAGSLYCRSLPGLFRVWNPTTRESVNIKVDGALPRDINHFGFDPVEKKHKVLSILREHYTSKVIGSRVFILEDDCWRTTANPYPPCLLGLHTKNVICIDGIIFFQARTPASKWSRQELVAFHVRSETFELISLPETATYRRLIEFTGRATLYDSDYGPCTVITLWMLEGPRKQVWRCKTCVIPDYDLGSLWLHGGTPAGELLFTGGGKNLLESFFLLLYNVESNTTRRIEVRGLPEDIPQQVRLVKPEKVYFHVDSLKPPKLASSLTSGTHIKTLNRLESRVGSARRKSRGKKM